MRSNGPICYAANDLLLVARDAVPITCVLQPRGNSPYFGCQADVDGLLEGFTSTTPELKRSAGLVPLP